MSALFRATQALPLPVEQRALCTLQEAVCLLANQTIAEPADPCAAEPALKDIPKPETSRTLLAFLETMRALAAWRGKGDPPAPQDGQDRRLAHSKGATPHWSDAEIWEVRVHAMRGHCADTGELPAFWVGAWAKYEPAALAHLEALKRRERNMWSASERLRAAVMNARGPRLCGRDHTSGAFGEVPRAILFDPSTHWAFEREPNDHCIRFTGRLAKRSGGLDELSFNTAEVMALVEGRGEDSKPTAPMRDKRTLRVAVKEAALALFPAGPPKGMRADTRYAKINEELARRCGSRASDRTIRTATADLEAEGHWRHGRK